ncbi:hypothetical protein ACS7SF_02760 [Ralstonia sp. 25C]|uniref:hypothetical protein n=1 Tax=Ralstonia sp. 25C TaxID=3447363 RepID=UPI003F74F6CA
MARARNIKPSFFLSERLAEISPLGRLLFQALWCMADRAGRLEDRPRRIKVEALPYDECDVDALLWALARLGFIERYAVGDARFIQVVNFAKHQNPHVKEAASTVPAPDSTGASMVQEIHTCEATQEHAGASESRAPDEHHASTVQKLLIPDSGFLIPDSNTPPTLANASVPPPCAATTKPGGKRKTAMPPDFGISPRVSEWACAKGYGNLTAHLESFRAKCHAKGYRYADWDSAFMEAIRADWAGLAKAQGNAAKFDPTAYVNRNRRPDA